MDISKRGVYYNLELSPFRHNTPEGIVYVFSSAKKLEIFNNKIQSFKHDIAKLTKKHGAALSFFRSSEAWEKFYENTYKDMQV